MHGPLAGAHIQKRLGANAHGGHLNIHISVPSTYQNDSAILGSQVAGRRRSTDEDIASPYSRRAGGNRILAPDDAGDYWGG